MKIFDFFIFRHGETDWNRQKRLQGHSDIPLNSEGIRQAQSLKGLVQDLRPQVILTSDLVRAKLTAEIVNAEMQVPLVLEPRLRECGLGDFEGRYWEQILATEGMSQWERWTSARPEDQDFAFPNGESKRHHLQRLTEALEDFCHANPETLRIGVSTHGGSLRRLIDHCANPPMEAAAVPNCALYQIRYLLDGGGWVFDRRVGGPRPSDGTS